MKGEMDARAHGAAALARAGYRKKGGSIHGKTSRGRPDKRARGGATGDDIIDRDQPDDDQGNTNASSKLARGGKVKGKTIINIDASHKGDPQAEQMARQEGMQQGAHAIAAKLAGGAPGGPPPGGGPPPPPMPPPGGMPPGAMPPGAMPPHPMMPPGGAPPMPPGAPPPHPMMPPPGAGGGNPGMMRPPGMSTGGRMRDVKGRFLGGGV